MHRVIYSFLFLLTISHDFGSSLPARAAITTSGSLSSQPNGADPWTLPVGLLVGINGNGAVSVTGGSDVSTPATTIGVFNNGNGAVTVTDAGSTWSTTGEMQIGSGGTGSLQLLAGSTVTNGVGSIARFANSKGTVSVGGGGSLWSNSTNLYVGHQGEGTLLVEAGGTVGSTHGHLGYESSGKGSATIMGLNSKWLASGILDVGSAGTGTLTIVARGYVSNTAANLGYEVGASGSVLVSGEGSQWANSGDLRVGRDGTGHLSIQAGGVVTNALGSIASSAKSSGTVLVSDPGSTWKNNGSLRVGVNGEATLTISGGGKVENDFGLIAFGSGSGSVTVTGTNSKWISSLLSVGAGGTGSLRVENRGIVSNTNGRIGAGPDATGSAIVTGVGSAWNNSAALRVGDEGVGTLAVEAGGTVTSSVGYIGHSAGSSGTVTITGAGSAWISQDSIHIGESGTGALTVLDGGEVFAASGVSIGPNGTVSGNGIINAGVVNFGTVAPGASTGGLFVTGNYAQTTLGTLAIELGGALPGIGYDVLNVGGTATLNGTLDVSLTGGFMPAAGQQFQVLTASNIVNGGLALGGSAASMFDLIVGSNSLILQRTNASMPGDFDHDGTVDGHDFLLWQRGGSPNPLSAGDLADWQAHYGSGSLVSAAVPVPEPSSLALLALGGLVSLLPVRRAARYLTLPACVMMVLTAGGATVQAAIVTSGSLSPQHNGTDPWALAVGLSVGLSGAGEVTVSGGSDVSNTAATIGVFGSSTGTVTVTGAGSTWGTSGIIQVGSGGTGALNVSNGGSVTNATGSIGRFANSNGSVSVTGVGTRWTNSSLLTIGEEGAGTLSIEAGGSVSSPSGIVGYHSGATGAVLVTGAGSAWNNSGSLHVGGHSGSGEMTITAEGGVSSVNAIIGNNSGATGKVMVAGANSTWVNTGSLRVGSEGSGELTIADGGGVSSTLGILAFTPSSTGTAFITGVGSQWISDGSLTVGDLGTATMSISAGGTVTSGDGYIGYRTSSLGTTNVTGAGSKWTVSGRLSIGGNAATGVNGGAGTLNINPGAAVNVAQDVVLFPDAQLRFQGGTLATTTLGFQGGQFQWTSGKLHIDTFNGNLTNPSGGTLAPGRPSPGTSSGVAGNTTVTGHYTQQAGAKLEIEIGEVFLGTFDRLLVEGNALINGALDVALVDGFTPVLGNTFTILETNFGNISGTFNWTAMPIFNNLTFDVIYNPKSVVLQVVQATGASLPGDFDYDGTVDGHDFLLWQRGGSPSPLSAGDLADWQTHYGSGSLVSAAVAVPEPTSLALLALAGVLLALRNRSITTSACSWLEAGTQNSRFACLPCLACLAALFSRPSSKNSLSSHGQRVGRNKLRAVPALDAAPPELAYLGCRPEIEHYSSNLYPPASSQRG